MELLNDLIKEPHWLISTIVLILIGLYFIAKQLKSMKHAEHIVKRGQFEPLRQDVLNEAINDAQEKGNKDQFLQLLTQIRQTYGHDGVKLGHLYWIWRMIEEDELNPKHIPDFNFEFLPLKKSVLNEAVKDAESQGNKEQFLKLLEQIISTHGNNNLKMGHLKWIWDMIEINDLEPMNIPAFSSKKTIRPKTINHKLPELTTGFKGVKKHYLYGFVFLVIFSLIFNWSFNELLVGFLIYTIIDFLFANKQEK
ncbi:hypothetical protein [uncultured Shewanella sp.]|uniref:hypothetical protein n=1 Tax=uncultured Shewanella sp. TaxID=173975 RepID=UPI00261E01F5|nr:hypothetical protein [uncultured Shewanella sp.]